MRQSPCVFQPKGKVLLYSRCLSEAVLPHSRRSRASLGAHYIARYSLCKGIGSTFPQNVVGAVHISTELTSIFSKVQAASSSDALAAKDVLFLVIGFVGRDRVQIDKAGLAGKALFSDFDLNANQRGFVRDHVNEARMWNAQ
jgi:hypothetical protein